MKVGDRVISEMNSYKGVIARIFLNDNMVDIIRDDKQEGTGSSINGRRTWHTALSRVKREVINWKERIK